MPMPCMRSRSNAFLTHLFYLNLTGLILGRHKPILCVDFFLSAPLILVICFYPRKNDDEACNARGSMAPHDETHGTPPKNVPLVLRIHASNGHIKAINTMACEIVWL